jgi:hypothetical protein
MMISKMDLKCFQINLMLESFMCLTLELLEILKKLYSLGITFCFQNFDPNYLTVFLLFTFFFKFALCFLFFSNKNCQVKKN